MTVIYLVMINTEKYLLQNRFILLAPIIILPPLVVHIDIILVLANALLAIIIPFSEDINPHIVLLLNHVLVTIEVDHTLIQKNCSNFQYKPYVILTQQPTPILQNTSSTEPKFE